MNFATAYYSRQILLSIRDSEVKQSLFFLSSPEKPAPVPLLGTGLVDVDGAIRNRETSNIPLVGALDRVTIACGTVRKTSGDPLSGSAYLWWLLAAPAILSLIWSGKRAHNKSSNRV
jgi:hypothetical protein